MSRIRSVRVEQLHIQYETHRQLLNHRRPTEYEAITYNYRVNTQISTIRCYWQHMVSSIAGADLVNIKVRCPGRQPVWEVVPNRHRGVIPITVGDLATIVQPDWNNDPNFRLVMKFYYVNNLAILPDCICNM